MTNKIKDVNTHEENIAFMSDGNIGALTALMHMDSFLRGLYSPEKAENKCEGYMVTLDTCQIYGEGIYILWADKCCKNSHRLMVLIKAIEIGVLSQDRLRLFAGDQMNEHNFTDNELRHIVETVFKTFPELTEGL